MGTSNRKPAIDPNFPVIEGPIEPTEDDYVDVWIPECDEPGFAHMSTMEKLRALTDRSRPSGWSKDESSETANEDPPAS
jgi:hypothetical protein